MPEVNIYLFIYFIFYCYYYFFGVFMDRDEVDINNNAKRTRPYLEQQMSFVRKGFT